MGLADLAESALHAGDWTFVPVDKDLMAQGLDLAPGRFELSEVGRH